jgi:hypothetical protein
MPFWGFKQKMIMIVHQAIGVALPLLLFDFVPQEVEKSTPIHVIKIDGLPPVPTGRHMIEGTLIFQSQLSSHSRGSLPGKTYKVKK